MFVSLSLVFLDCNQGSQELDHVQLASHCDIVPDNLFHYVDLHFSLAIGMSIGHWADSVLDPMFVLG